MKGITTAVGRSSFKCEGNTSSDILLLFKSTTITISNQLIQATLTNFKNKKVIGCFSMTEPAS